jgi:hypothetical protein
MASSMKRRSIDKVSIEERGCLLFRTMWELSIYLHTLLFRQSHLPPLFFNFLFGLLLIELVLLNLLRLSFLDTLPLNT